MLCTSSFCMKQKHEAKSSELIVLRLESPASPAKLSFSLVEDVLTPAILLVETSEKILVTVNGTIRPLGSENLTAASITSTAQAEPKETDLIAASRTSSILSGHTSASAATALSSGPLRMAPALALGCGLFVACKMGILTVGQLHLH